MKKAAIISLILLHFASGEIIAHGLHLEPAFHHPAVVVTSKYSANQPAANAIVSVFSPSDPEGAFQTGITDKTGRFAFIPDAEGEWSITVDDQKGHKGKIAISVSGQFLNPSPETPVAIAPAPQPVETEINHDQEHTMPVSYRIITGLSIIFGLTGILYGFRSAGKQQK